MNVLNKIKCKAIKLKLSNSKLNHSKVYKMFIEKKDILVNTFY